MDIYCPKAGCGEPVDNDSLHDAVADGLHADYRAAAAAFRSQGCEAIGFVHSVGNDSTGAYGLTNAQAAEALYDLLGDDMDGMAAMMEDFGF